MSDVTLANPRRIDFEQYSGAGCRDEEGICSDISVANCCKAQSSTCGIAFACAFPLQDGEMGVVHEMEGNKRCGEILDSQTGPVSCIHNITIDPEKSVRLAEDLWMPYGSLIIYQ